MKMKHYMDIERLKPSFADGFAPGDHITISEKLDGSNFSIRYDPETDSIAAFSRRKQLDEVNNLRGAWQWAQAQDSEKIKKVLGSNMVAFGEWLCLSGDTVIRKTSAGKNSNYMTLREMYKYSVTPLEERKYWRRKDGTEASGLFERCSWWERYGYPSLFSLDFEKDKIVPNKMKRIEYVGDKDVYRVVTRKGFVIKSTLNHKFLTPYGFEELENLDVYDCVAVSYLKNVRKGRTFGAGARELQTRMKNYKNAIGKCEICGKTESLELHHIDKNYNNNDVSNWMVLCSGCHSRVHKDDKKFTGVAYDYEFDYIISIEHVGVEDCYDIEMEGDESVANFVADGFVVHNCKHTVPYPDERYNQPYFFDVYDTESQCYLTYEEAREIIDLLDFNFVPVFYDGEFTSWDDVKKYIGQTDLGGEYGEGIVVKNQTRLNDPNTRMPFYTKIVTDKFRETKGQRHNKPVDMDKLAERTRVQELVDSVVTEARVRKLVLKMVDDGLIPEEWDNHDMSTIAKNLGKAVYYDCQKEEPEVVEEAGPMFGKTAGVTAMRIVREILEDRMVA